MLEFLPLATDKIVFDKFHIMKRWTKVWTRFARKNPGL
jgi:hypothetical protein